MMTFNEQSELLQTVYNSIYLAEQRPFRPNLELFNAFVGKVYTLQLWEASLEVPLNQDTIKNNTNRLLIDLDFTMENYKDDQTFKGWTSPSIPDSLNISSSESQGWMWEYDTLPLDKVLQPNLTNEMIEAQYSHWNETVCSNPISN